MNKAVIKAKKSNALLVYYYCFLLYWESLHSSFNYLGLTHISQVYITYHQTGQLV